MSENREQVSQQRRLESDREWTVSRDVTHGSCASVSTAIVDAVAEVKGVSPLDIRQPLYEVIDLDALESLFRDDASVRNHVYFTFNDCEVTVTAGGKVTVEPVE